MPNMIDGVRRIGGRSAMSAMVLVAALAATAARAEAQTTPATTTTSSSSASGTGSGSVISLGSTGRVVFVVLIVAIFATLWFAVIVFDRVSVNKRLNTMLAEFLAEMKQRKSDAGPSVTEIQAISGAMSSQPGTQGLTRTLLALGLLTLIGVALLALLVGNGAAASDLLKGVVTALTTALTTVLGFYFGAKTATDAAAAANAPTTGQPSAATMTPPGAPTNVVAKAGDGQAEVSFDAPASGGSPITNYTVTSTPGRSTATGNKSPLVVKGLENGVEYSFTVHATNAIGDSQESAPSKPVTPQP